MPRFDLASFNKRKKGLRQQMVNKTRAIQSVEQDICDVNNTLKRKREELGNKIHKCQRLDEKVRRHIFFLCKGFVLIMCSIFS